MLLSKPQSGWGHPTAALRQAARQGSPGCHLCRRAARLVKLPASISPRPGRGTAQKCHRLSRAGVCSASWNCFVGPFPPNSEMKLTVEGRNRLRSDPACEQHDVFLNRLSIVFSISYTVYFSTAEYVEVVGMNRLFRNGKLNKKHTENVQIHIKFMYLKCLDIVLLL